MDVSLSYINSIIGISLPENEVVRTSLMSGILKTARHNKDHPKPIKIFEVGDIVLLDNASEVGAVNRHQLAALYCGATSGFELRHGLVDRTMEMEHYSYQLGIRLATILKNQV
ncbi:aminoacyl-tRNA synthetase [Lithospermum erythrorhizon]|uniref:Aminoacyl-tRNA synthetase n=1 Tax=Lithospermum erythrorhizon TaxID=34254 RepID=A0AAV3RUB5_LITER